MLLEKELVKQTNLCMQVPNMQTSYLRRNNEKHYLAQNYNTKKVRSKQGTFLISNNKNIRTDEQTRNVNLLHWIIPVKYLCRQ